MPASRLRERLERRHRSVVSLERRTIEVGGADRAYWIAPRPPGRTSPLLVALHGLGMNGPRMASWTGLAVRGPQAGFATVFPDARAEVWDDHGNGRSDGLDDAAFIATLVQRLRSDGVAGAGPPVLVGLSNGAFFAERLARAGLVDVAGIVLAAGTAREASRRATPRPARATAVLCFAGTADPIVPYGGGRARGLPGLLVPRRRRRHLVDAGGHGAVAAETVAADWAQVNGCNEAPAIERLPVDGDLAVERLTWTASGRPPVVLYKIIGGGHAWPGGPRYAPAWLVGPVARELDATGILLEFAVALTA